MSWPGLISHPNHNQTAFYRHFSVLLIHAIASTDRSLFQFLNGLNSPFFDFIMWYGTRTITWLPLFILLLWLVVRNYGWKSIWIILFAALLMGVSDQLCNLVKENVARPRPSHNPEMTGLHTVNGYLGGAYGFYSAHASNNMALAVFLVMLLGRIVRGFTLGILLWAVFMAYTRIYLGVHYPADILAGWLVGICLGYLTGRACRAVIGSPHAVKQDRWRNPAKGGG